MAKRSPQTAIDYDAYRAPDGCWRPPRPEGLARVLAKAGYGARPRAEDLVRSGRVRVNGKVETDPGCKICVDSDLILDGEPLCEAPRRYLALHKPPGCECQVVGAGSRGLGILLPAASVGLEPAGRLDARGGGLLLLSNDLRWNQHVAESDRLERRFEVVVSGQMNSMALDVVRAGISLTNQGAFRPDRVELLVQDGGQARLLVALRGDHARKVRLAFASLLYEVLSLTRVGIGPVELDALARGRHRDLTPDELRQLEPPQEEGS